MNFLSICTFFLIVITVQDTAAQNVKQQQSMTLYCPYGYIYFGQSIYTSNEFHSDESVNCIFCWRDSVLENVLEWIEICHENDLLMSTRDSSLNTSSSTCNKMSESLNISATCNQPVCGVNMLINQNNSFQADQMINCSTQDDCHLNIYNVMPYIEQLLGAESSRPGIMEHCDKANLKPISLHSIDLVCPKEFKFYMLQKRNQSCLESNWMSACALCQSKEDQSTFISLCSRMNWIESSCDGVTNTTTALICKVDECLNTSYIGTCDPGTNISACPSRVHPGKICGITVGDTEDHYDRFIYCETIENNSGFDYVVLTIIICALIVTVLVVVLIAMLIVIKRMKESILCKKEIKSTDDVYSINPYYGGDRTPGKQESVFRFDSPVRGDSILDEIF